MLTSVPLLGGYVEGVEVEAGAERGGLEVVEREEEADDLEGAGLRRDVERGLPAVCLRGGERRGGAGRLGVGQQAADGAGVRGSDGREERLVGERREIHRREGERASGCRGKPTDEAGRRTCPPSLSVQSSDW